MIYIFDKPLEKWSYATLATIASVFIWHVATGLPGDPLPSGDALHDHIVGDAAAPV